MSDKLKVKIDGLFIVVEGACPMCVWKHPHSHVKEAFHQFLDERKAARETVKTTTNADKPALPKPNGTTVGKVDTPKPAATVTKSTTPTPKPKINVYRIRTVGGGLSLDRSIMAQKKKEAINSACGEHARMVDNTPENVNLAFCRFIGQCSIPDPYGYASDWGWWD